MLADFPDWSAHIHTVLSHIPEPSVEQWALFDAPHAPTYTAGLVCLMGDAAHASLPHQGAGGGMAFEDAFVLGNLVADACRPSDPAGPDGSKGGATPADLQAAFRAYDAVRRPRTQRLVQTSREAGELYAAGLPGSREGMEALMRVLQERHEWIWTFDLEGDLERARGIVKGEEGEGEGEGEGGVGVREGGVKEG